MIGLTPNKIKHIYTTSSPEIDKVYYKLILNGNTTIYTGVGYTTPNTNKIEIDVTDIIMSIINLDTLLNNENLFGTTPIPYKVNTSTINYQINISEVKNGIFIDYFFGDFIHYEYKNDYYTRNYTKSDFLQRNNNYSVIRGATIHCDFLSNGTNITYPNVTFGVKQDNTLNIMSKTVTEPSHYHWNKTDYSNSVKSYQLICPERTVNIDIIDSCKYSGQLYWVNRIGGIETIPILTSSKKRELTDRTTYRNNNMLADRSFYFDKKVYKNNILTQYSLITPLLGKNDIKWIEELFVSNYVFYYDKATNKTYSVLVTDNEFEFKKSDRNLGKIYYEINIEGSQINTVR